jgi:hypothetical protein
MNADYMEKASKVLATTDKLTPQNFEKALRILDDLVARQEQAKNKSA